MNKIKTRTYLYKEVLNNFNNDLIDKIIILGKGMYIEKFNKNNFLYTLSPMLEGNVGVYNKLFKYKFEYIYNCDISAEFIEPHKHINILKIGDKYEILVVFKRETNKTLIEYVQKYIAITLSDIVLINKIKNIKEGLQELDIALSIGKEIYAIPGSIFEYSSYLSNFAIKQGAVPICNIYDVDNIL